MRAKRGFSRSKNLEAEGRIRGWNRGEQEQLSEVQDLVLTATSQATPSLRDIAAQANISESTLSSWRRGTRTPPPDAIEVLAAVLRERAQGLEVFARLLERASASQLKS